MRVLNLFSLPSFAVAASRLPITSSVSFFRRSRLAAAVLGFSLCVTASASTFTVTRFDDTAANGPNAGDGLGTGVSGDLRWAILQANAGGGTNLIQFNCASAPCTVTLNGPLPPIFATTNIGSYNLTIDGGAYGDVILDGAGKYRVFFVDNVAVTLENLVIQNASATGGNGGGGQGGAGGGGGGAGFGAGLFVNQSTAVVTVETTTFTNCSVTGGQGGAGGTGYRGNGGGGMGFASESGQSSGGGGGGVTGPGNGGSGGSGGGGGTGQGGSGYADNPGGKSGQNQIGGAGGFGGGGGADYGAGAGGFGGGGAGAGADVGGNGGFGGGGGGAATVAASGGTSPMVGGVAGGAGGNYKCCWPEVNDNGSPGGGGAAAGPAIFVAKGSLTLHNVTGSGFTATAGKPGTFTSNSLNAAASAGTANSAAVFNYGGTVNGSTTVGAVAGAISGEQVPGTTPASTGFGSVAVGSSVMQPLFFTVASGTSVGSIGILTLGAPNLDFTDAGGSTCRATHYDSDTSCTVEVKFTPAFAGSRSGAVVFYSGAGRTGTVLATAYIYGTGTGPQIAFGPPVQSSLGGGFSGAEGSAFDGAGNIYIADQTNNAVKEMSLTCTAAAFTSHACTTTSLGGGFSADIGVALDGAGNIYVADQNHNAVKEMPPGCSSSGCVISLGGNFAFGAVYGVALDGAGNVYVGSEAGIHEMPPNCLSSQCVTNLGGGFIYPHGVAVDAAGNIYVADQGKGPNGGVTEMPPGCSSVSCVTTLGGGFSAATGIALDAAGNVYVANYLGPAFTLPGNVKEMPPGCTASAYSSHTCTITTLGSGFLLPVSVSVDSNGNVYIGDLDEATFTELSVSAPPALTFPTATGVGGPDATDDPLGFTVANIGNAPLVFPAPNSGANPSVAPGFLWDSSSTCSQLSSSSSAFSLDSGNDCTMEIDFQPAAVGAITGSVVLTDNHLNVTKAKQSVLLSGTGVAAASAPSITAVFGAASVPLNGTTTVTFTITNPNPSTSLTGVAFTDTLPAGLVVSSSVNLSFNCAGGAAPQPGSSIISLTDATLPGGGSCHLTVGVTGTTAGVKSDSVSVTSTNGGTGNTASASITVVGPPSLSASFIPGTIGLGQTSSLVLTVANPNTSHSLSGIAFSDTLPTGLTVGSFTATACSTGTVTAGSGMISLTGLTLDAGSQCSMVMTVTGTAAAIYTNTTGAVTSNEGGSGSAASAGLTVNPAATTTTASNQTATYSASSQNVTLSAKVTSGGGTVDAGTVTFTVLNGGTPVGTATTSGTVSGGSASVSYAIPGGTSQGIYTIQAVYNAGSNFATSSDNTHTLTVNGANTTTSASNQTATYSASSQNVTLSAMVTSLAGTVNAGTVTFTVLNGGTPVGTATTSGTVTNGSASVSYAIPGGTSQGTYTIQAVYNAGSNFATSSDNTHTLTVNSANTTTSASNQTATYSASSQNVTLSAKVTSGGGTVNAGTVTFTVLNGGTPVGTATTSGTVTNGSASVSYVIPGGTSQGTYTIQAVYNAGSNFATSSDNTHTLTLNGANTTTGASNQTATYSASSQNVTLSATVTSGGGTVNAGTVTFTLLNGGTPVGTATTSGTVTNGSASVSYAIPGGTSQGTYTIQAVYNAGSNFATSSDNTHTLTLNGANTTTGASNQTATYSASSQNVTLQASVTSLAGTVNGGTVTFTLLNASNQTVGTATTSGTVSNGGASVSYALPGGTLNGTYTIQAAYNGSSDFNASNDSAHTLTVNGGTTTTAGVNAAATYNASSQVVQLSAKVTSSAGTVNSGTVSFSVFAGPTQIGSATSASAVSNGAASANYTLPGGTNAGTYTIVASYTGANGYLSSSDNSHTLTVSAAGTTTMASNQSTNYSASVQSVFLSAAVTSGAGAVNAGTVTFTLLKGATPVGTATTSAPVSNGNASVSYSLPAAKAAGNYTIQAVYSGSTDFTASSDTMHTLTVNAVPIASIMPANGIDFGTLYQGNVVTKTITITNVGDSPLTISNPIIAVVTGGNSNEYLTVNHCPKSLAPGSQCTMTVTIIAGPYYSKQTAAVEITDNAAGSPQAVPLTATVIDPQIQFTPSKPSFGKVKEGNSLEKTVLVTSTGGTALDISSVSIAGADPHDFTEIDNCVGSFAPTTGCSITVTFKPTAKNSRSATLIVTDNMQTKTQSISLSGTGD